MKAEEIGRKAIRIVDGIVNTAVLTVIILLLAFAGYALWDSNQIHLVAEKSNYAVYKPTAENEGKTFQELQTINPEVFAWLEIYGTSIDYPVTQGADNMKYVNTDAEGRYSLSGAIFLDEANSRDFSDFNSILYGHHMEKRTMFGEIGEFSFRSKFDAYRYGNLYFDGKDHGVEFFAFVRADAYDRGVYAPNVDHPERSAYLDGLYSKAMHKRDIDVTVSHNIVLLSTCSSSSTNGRDILVGRITDGVFENPFGDADAPAAMKQALTDSLYCHVAEIPPWPLLLVLVVMTRLIMLVTDVYRREKQLNKAETV